jgi:hypothetical protein
MSFGAASQSIASHPLRQEIIALVGVAMLVFCFTVGVGILNGTDLVDFDHKTILAHVHTGTLGWITTSVFAASLWLFGRTAANGWRTSARLLTGVAVVTLPLFAFTFAFTYGSGRTFFGSLALATIVGFFIWVAGRFRQVDLTVAHLGFLAALATSVVGGSIGVMLAARIATGTDAFPAGASDAHPATMVVGFLIPVGMALAEWGLCWPRLEPPGWRGTLQIAFPFAGGIVIMLGLLFDITPLTPLGALLELAGVVLFVWRLWPPFRAVDWQQPGPMRFAALSCVAILFNILLINYFAARYEGDFDMVPTRHLLALDHAMFIGVLTNAIFAMLTIATSGNRRWPMADTLILVGVNVGLVGFVIGLFADATWIVRFATPLMGVSILAGLATFGARIVETYLPTGAPPEPGLPERSASQG